MGEVIDFKTGKDINGGEEETTISKEEILGFSLILGYAEKIGRNRKIIDNLKCETNEIEERKNKTQIENKLSSDDIIKKLGEATEEEIKNNPNYFKILLEEYKLIEKKYITKYHEPY